MLVPSAQLQDPEETTEPASPPNIDPLDVIRAAASLAASHITRPLMLRSDKAEKDLAKQLEREFAASIAYWDLHFASGGDRVVKTADRTRSGRASGERKAAPRLLAASPR